MTKNLLRIEKGALHKITVAADTTAVVSSATIWTLYDDREPTLNSVLTAGSELLLGPYLNITTFEIQQTGNVTIEEIGDDFSTPVPVSGYMNETVGVSAGNGFDIGTDKTLRFVDTAISSAEILALHTVPKTIVPAQGANTVIQYVSSILFLDYNSAAYAGIAAGDDLEIRYTDENGSTVGGYETTGLLDQTEDHIRSGSAYGPLLSVAEMDVNAPLTLSLAGAIITGNSPIGIRTYYRVIDLSTLSAV